MRLPMPRLRFVPAVHCPVCRGPVERECFPLCSICDAALVPCPPLCAACGSPACGFASACLRPWARAPEVESWNAQYLLVARGYDVLKRWKTRRGPAMNGRILRLSAELRDRIASIEPDAVVPIPQSYARAWRLGGSPALELAGWIARETGRRAWRAAHALELAGPGGRARPRQATLNAASRYSNRLDLRAGAQAPALAGKRVLLVDDFMTTGHTLRSAARALAGLPRPPAGIHVFALGARPPVRVSRETRGDPSPGRELRSPEPR